MAKCKYCDRELPNKEHKTKNGCKWCSVNYHEKSYNKGKNNPTYKDGRTLKKYKCIDCNKKIVYRAKRCQSCKQKGKLNSNYKKIWYQKFAKENSNWTGGISKLGYSYIFNKTLKKYIRQLFNYTCQLCFEYGKDVHHIDYNKENCKEANLTCLCNKCNSKVNYNRDYYYAYFIYMKENNHEKE